MLKYQSQLTSNADCTLDLSSSQGEKWSFWHCDTWWKLWGCTCTALASKAKGDGDSIKMLIYYTASQLLELWKWWHDICFNINHSARHFVYLYSCEAVQRQEEQKDLEILQIQQPNPLRWNQNDLFTCDSKSRRVWTALKSYDCTGFLCGSNCLFVETMSDRNLPCFHYTNGSHTCQDLWCFHKAVRPGK